MKFSFRPRRCLSAGMLAAVLAGSLAVTRAQEAPVLSPAAAEVLKLVQAGVGTSVIKTYIGNLAGAFNLDTQTILYLNDAGVPTEVVDTMMDHDKTLAAPVAPPAPAEAPQPAPVEAPADSAAAAPTAAVTVDDFTQTLAPYGTWVDVAGYGRCWRPTVAVYDATWQPYGDRGHWVNTDAGWYWDSEYAWGVAFHYGRWFRQANYGWCWWPDTVWAPSWVTWRSSDDYCGWAPLPPFSGYRPGLGFYYRGASVSVGFDFGLDAGLFMFVPLGHFCEPHPRYYRVDRDRGAEIFRRTEVVNRFDLDRHDNRFMNRGISVERVNSASHHNFTAVRVDQVPHAERQEWHGTAGGGFNPGGHAAGPGARPGGFNNENHGGANFSPEPRHEVTPFHNSNNNPGPRGAGGMNPEPRPGQGQGQGQGGGYPHTPPSGGGNGNRPAQPGNMTPHATPPANGQNGGGQHGFGGFNTGPGQSGGNSHTVPGGYNAPRAEQPVQPVQPRSPAAPAANPSGRPENNNNSGWSQNRSITPVAPSGPGPARGPAPAPASPGAGHGGGQPHSPDKNGH